MKSPLSRLLPTLACVATIALAGCSSMPSTTKQANATINNTSPDAIEPAAGSTKTLPVTTDDARNATY